LSTVKKKNQMANQGKPRFN